MWLHGISRRDIALARDHDRALRVVPSLIWAYHIGLHSTHHVLLFLLLFTHLHLSFLLLHPVNRKLTLMLQVLLLLFPHNLQLMGHLKLLLSLSLFGLSTQLLLVFFTQCF